MKLLIRLYLLAVGLFLFALGLVFAINSNLGLAPWNCLNDGLIKHVPITFGQANIMVGIIIVLVNILAKQKIGFGTLANMTLIGIYIDLLNHLTFLPKNPGMYNAQGEISPVNIAYGTFLIICGLTITAIGCMIYLKAEFGAGPRDGLMLALMYITGKPLAVCRISIELCVFAVGFLLGGSIGIGTIVSSTLNGFIIQTVFKLFKFNPKTLKHEYLDDQLRMTLKKA